MDGEKKTFKMAVACRAADGSPDMFFVKVRALQAEFDSGDADRRAKEEAEAEGYEEPMIVYSQGDWMGRILAHACSGNFDQAPEVDAEHEHESGPLEESRMAGTLHRKCQVPGCRQISLDI